MSYRSLRTIGYIRVSTEMQENSVISQKEMIEHYSKLNGIEVDDYFVDFGISGGSTMKREKYLELQELITNGMVRTIITTSLSRWSRNTLDLLQSIELLKKHKVDFRVIKEQVNLNTPMGEFFCSILGSVYSLERNLCSERTRDVMKSKKESGKTYSRVPYGYKSVDGMLVENNTEQKLLRKMYRLRSKGESYLSISKFLNRNKYKTKMGKDFTKENVYSLLKTDRKSIGLSTTNGTIHQ